MSVQRWVFSVIAAFALFGHAAEAIVLSTVLGSEECVLTVKPTPSPCGTTKDRSESPRGWIAGGTIARSGGTLCQPADVKRSSIFTRRAIASASAATEVKAYLVFLYLFRSFNDFSVSISDLGSLRRFNCAVASSPILSASERCASASAACCFATLMSASEEFTSKSAPFAAAAAFDDAATALPAASLAASASSLAFLADVAASPASRIASRTLESLHSWILASKSLTFTSAYLSPPTPATISSQPTNASTFAACNRCSGGVSIRCLKYGIQSRAISFSSYRSSGNSSSKPTNTVPVNPASTWNQWSRGFTKSFVAHWLNFATRSSGSITGHAHG